MTLWPVWANVYGFVEHQTFIAMLMFCATVLSAFLFATSAFYIGAGADFLPSDSDTCSDGWRITGYFTPVETDYKSGEMTEIEVAKVGSMSFDAQFVRTVFDESKGFGEGWGKTRFGWYLGNYGGRWHKADAPLDANNAPLRTNSVAVDNSLIPNDSTVTIPGLPGAFGSEKFIANDVGVTVHGKHIDVYTGEGREAGLAMYRVTFEDDDLQKVCFKPPAEPDRK
jgi:3D (Asp-Asp-Asp) domain-containing protein